MFEPTYPCVRHGTGTLTSQVVNGLRRAIIDGQIPAGSRLPSTRQLARDLGVSRNTMLAAFDQLTAEGFIVARVGAGSFAHSAPWPRASCQHIDAPPAAKVSVSAYAQRAMLQIGSFAQATAAKSCRFDLGYGVPLVLPGMQAAWRRALQQAADNTIFDYPPVAGLPRLQRALAGYLMRRRGLIVDPEDVLIVNGTQQAIELAARVLLDPGQRALVEDPCYQGLRQCFLAQGLALDAIAVDQDGICTDQLAGQSARLLAVTPSHQFPSGGICSLTRRADILAWAEQHQAFVIEDDYDGEFRHGGRPLAALKSLDRTGRVIYLGSFSKVLFPALRLGFLVVPAALRAAFYAAKWLADRGCAAIEQQALAALIEGGQFERLLLRTSRHLDERRRALINAISRHFGTHARVVGAETGMHICLWLDTLRAADESRLIDAAAARDVRIYGISAYYQQPPPTLGLLLGYGHLSAGAIDESIRRLARLASELMSSQTGDAMVVPEPTWVRHMEVRGQAPPP